MTDETNRLLYQILLYTRAQAVATARQSALAVVDSPRKAQVYSLMDGTRSQKQIVEIVKAPQATVSRHMISFFKAGLAVPAGEHYSGPKALFTLDELGIDEGQLSKKATQTEETE